MNKLLLFMVASTSVVLAQSEPGSAASQAQPAEATIVTQTTIEEDKDVGNQINEFLAAKGWSEGENKKKGELFFIAIGQGVIQAPRTDQSYIASRINAYNKAMLDAKKQMVEYLGVAIQTETAKTYSEGSFPQPATIKQETTETSRMKAKILLLINAKLDAALRANGVDPATATKDDIEKATKKEINSESFKKLIKTSASSFVIGMQSCVTFECIPANKKGQMGVIAIWSPKLQRMAEAISNGNLSMPLGLPKKPIVEQISTDPIVLLTTFGVQQKINEEGKLVLVSYGQGGAVSDSPTSANAAKSKAQQNAQAAIREFAGESVATSTDQLQAETVKEFEDKTDAYANESAYKEKIAATAAKMNISGIATIKRWQVKHPINGNTVYGTICTWSPDSAANAQMLKNIMDGVPTPQKQENVPPPAPEEKPNSKANAKSFKGSGQAIDNDAF